MRVRRDSGVKNTEDSLFLHGCSHSFASQPREYLYRKPRIAPKFPETFSSMNILPSETTKFVFVNVSYWGHCTLSLKDPLKCLPSHSAYIRFQRYILVIPKRVTILNSRCRIGTFQYWIWRLHLNFSNSNKPCVQF